MTLSRKSPSPISTLFWGKGIINSDQFVQIVYLTL